jgi:CheY-like chemotaxis protein
MKHDIEIEIVPLAEVPPEAEVCLEDRVPLVLVVDDETLLADTLAAVLATSGLEVVKAYNGRTALNVAMQRAPDLLLTDVMMPGMNGIELAMVVASELPECKVLLFSGHATELDLAPARAVGFDFPLMMKPMHPVEMMKRVFDCLGWQPESVEPRRTREPYFGLRMANGPQLVA